MRTLLQVAVLLLVPAWLLYELWWLGHEEPEASVSRACARVGISGTPSAEPQLAAAGKRALVTGGAGFIGSWVAQACADAGMAVTVVDDLSGGDLDNVPAGAEFLNGDLKDAAFVDDLFSGRRFDYVYHLAAYAAEGLSHFIRSYNYRNNLVSTALLINAAVRTNVSAAPRASDRAAPRALRLTALRLTAPERPASGLLLRLHLVHSSLRLRAHPSHREDHPPAGGPIRHRQVCRRARPRSGARPLRSKLRSATPAQRVRPAAVDRRPLSQRRCYLAPSARSR